MNVNEVVFLLQVTFGNVKEGPRQEKDDAPEIGEATPFVKLPAL
jgi:hypothetical protein